MQSTFPSYSFSKSPSNPTRLRRDPDGNSTGLFEADARDATAQ